MTTDKRLLAIWLGLGVAIIAVWSVIIWAIIALVLWVISR